MTIHSSMLVQGYNDRYGMGFKNLKEVLDHCYNVVSKDKRTGFYSVWRASDILGVSHRWFLGKMKEYGLKSRHRRFAHGEKKSLLLVDYLKLSFEQRNQSRVELSEILGCHVNYISVLKVKAGESYDKRKKVWL